MTAELLSPSAGPEFEGQTKGVFLDYQQLAMPTNQATGDKSRRHLLCLHVVWQTASEIRQLIKGHLVQFRGACFLRWLLQSPVDKDAHAAVARI